MKHERHCIMCGKIYKYCPHCNDYNKLPKWKTTFDAEICKDVFTIISSWRAGSSTKEEAREKLLALNLTGVDFVDSVRAAINEILSVEDDEIVSTVAEITIDEATEPLIEAMNAVPDETDEKPVRARKVRKKKDVENLDSAENVEQEVIE